MVLQPLFLVAGYPNHRYIEIFQSKRMDYYSAIVRQLQTQVNEERSVNEKSSEASEPYELNKPNEPNEPKDIELIANSLFWPFFRSSPYVFSH